jgi:hypothetical protein
MKLVLITRILPGAYLTAFTTAAAINETQQRQQQIETSDVSEDFWSE